MEPGALPRGCLTRRPRASATSAAIEARTWTLTASALMHSSPALQLPMICAPHRYLPCMRAARCTTDGDSQGTGAARVLTLCRCTRWCTQNTCGVDWCTSSEVLSVAHEMRENGAPLPPRTPLPRP